MLQAEKPGVVTRFPLQQFLMEKLESAGFECHLLEAEPTRANLVARLPGQEPGGGDSMLAARGELALALNLQANMARF